MTLAAIRRNVRFDGQTRLTSQKTKTFDFLNVR